jgi:hypothetical protein
VGKTHALRGRKVVKMGLLHQEGLLRCGGDLSVIRCVEGCAPEPGVVRVGQSEVDLAVAGSEASTPAVGLIVSCSGEDDAGHFYRDFELLLPPRAARALANLLVRRAAAAERSGAREWVTGEIQDEDGAAGGYAVRLVQERRRANSGRRPSARPMEKASAQVV